MNKTELVAAISEKTELTKKDSEKALKALIDVVAEELKKGEKVQLVGLVHLKYQRELQEQARTHRLVQRLRLPVSYTHLTLPTRTVV